MELVLLVLLLQITFWSPPPLPLVLRGRLSSSVKLPVPEKLRSVKLPRLLLSRLEGVKSQAMNSSRKSLSSTETLVVNPRMSMACSDCRVGSRPKNVGKSAENLDDDADN